MGKKHKRTQRKRQSNNIIVDKMREQKETERDRNCKDIGICFTAFRTNTDNTKTYLLFIITKYIRNDILFRRKCLLSFHFVLSAKHVADCAAPTNNNHYPSISMLWASWCSFEQDKSS